MINEQAVLTPSTRRRRATQPKPIPAPAPHLPERIAFAGCANAQKDAQASVHVQVLCWPIVPNAWSSLTQAWEIVRAGRGEATAGLAALNLPASWIRGCAPQLGAPFRDTPAEESSVAALLTRTPIEIAIAIVDSREAQGTAGVVERAQPQALSSCLATYSKVVRAQKRAPCALLISRTQGTDVDERFLKEFAHCRTVMTESEWLNELHLRFWNQAVEPLPLELAQVVAAAVLRHQLDDRGFNPIFEAVLTKLVHNPFPYKSPTKGKRR